MANEHGESFPMLYHHGSDLCWFSFNMVNMFQLLLVCYMNRFPHTPKKQAFDSLMIFKPWTPLFLTLTIPMVFQPKIPVPSCFPALHCPWYTRPSAQVKVPSPCFMSRSSIWSLACWWMIWCWSSQIKRNNMNALIVTVIIEMETVYDWYRNHHIYQHHHTKPYIWQFTWIYV